MIREYEGFYKIAECKDKNGYTARIYNRKTKEERCINLENTIYQFNREIAKLPISTR